MAGTTAAFTSGALGLSQSETGSNVSRSPASARSRYEHVYKLLACKGSEEAEKLIKRAIAPA